MQVEVNGFHPKALVFVSEKRCAFAAGKLIVEMDVESKKQRSPGSWDAEVVRSALVLELPAADV